MNARHFLIPWYVLRARRAVARARAAELPGLAYDAFGRKIGRRLLLGGVKGAVRLMLQPVDFLRFFEFGFVDQFVRRIRGRALDVSSPALFSLYQVSENPDLALRMINPDSRDLDFTNRIARQLHLKLEMGNQGIESIPSMTGHFNAIWSISVFEHVHGDPDDGEAIRILFDALAPGGSLILTVMVDRVYRDEYIDRDIYGLGVGREDQGFFFQRFYDECALHNRLINQIPDAKVTDISWYGEKRSGSYNAYIDRARRGFDYSWAVDEPGIAAEDYARYSGFSEMPGVGVCGIRLVKPD